MKNKWQFLSNKIILPLMRMLHTFGSAATVATQAKWTRGNPKNKIFYKAVCSLCNEQYDTNNMIEYRLSQNHKQNNNGICKSCRTARDQNSVVEIRAARLNLAIRRKKMRLKW